MATSRKPRWRLKTPAGYVALKSGEVYQNNMQHADKFTGVVVYRAGTGAQTVDWWLTEQPLFKVSFEFGYDSKGSVSWQQVFTGLIDSVDIDLSEGELTIKGRDSTSLFIDQKVAEAYTNKTASEVVAEFASKVGIQADIQGTSDLIGTYYAGDHTVVKHDQFSSSRTMWDFMCQLADYAGFRVWVDSTTDVLHFKDAEEFDEDSYPVTWTEPTVARNASSGMASTMINPRITHNCAASKDIKVVVRSWHSGKKAGFNASAGSKSSKAKTSPDVTIYTYKFPNLTLEQAQARANAIYADLMKHERVLETDLPGDFALNPRRKIALSGVGPNVDRDYFADEINHKFGDDGFLTSIRAKSIPPQADAEGDDGTS